MSLELLGAQDLAPPPPSRAARAWRRLGVALTGSALGMLLWPQHRVLAALAGGTLADNAHGLATGDTTWGEAAKSVGHQGVAIAAALSVPAHPATAYVLTNLVTHAVFDGDSLRSVIEGEPREVIDVQADGPPKALLAPAREGTAR